MVDKCRNVAATGVDNSASVAAIRSQFEALRAAVGTEGLEGESNGTIGAINKLADMVEGRNPAPLWAPQRKAPKHLMAPCKAR